MGGGTEEIAAGYFYLLDMSESTEKLLEIPQYRVAAQLEMADMPRQTGGINPDGVVPIPHPVPLIELNPIEVVFLGSVHPLA